MSDKCLSGTGMEEYLDWAKTHLSPEGNDLAEELRKVIEEKGLASMTSPIECLKRACEALAETKRNGLINALTGYFGSVDAVDTQTQPSSVPDSTEKRSALGDRNDTFKSAQAGLKDGMKNSMSSTFLFCIRKIMFKPNQAFQVPLQTQP